MTNGGKKKKEEESRLMWIQKRVYYEIAKFLSLEYW